MSQPNYSSPEGLGSQSPPPTAQTKSQNAQPRVRRRNRLITSCLECRRRKLKCDKTSPCANCTKNARPCVFIASGMDAESQARLAEVKEKMGMLERSLEEDVARKNRAKSNATGDRRSNMLPGQGLSHSDEEDEETKDLISSLIVSEDAAYYDDDANDDILDLGLAMGKLRISERIGGLVRPRFGEELARALSELPECDHPSLGQITYQDPQEWLAPSQDYIAPSSSFFFGAGIERTSVLTYLPARPLVEKLIAHYWEAVHIIARTVHRPTFERHYNRFWADIDAHIEPRNSFQAVVFAAMLSSIISMSNVKVLTDFGVDKQSLVNNFRLGTEAALTKANILRTTKLETLQAFVMYLIPLCRHEISLSHSALTGMCIRLAECMGLHRDPSTYSTSPVEVHIRRLVWYQICFLDLRTCESTGPRPQIRPDDYDTRFPLNIDDIDLQRAENGDKSIDVTNDRPYFTDMTITRMRFEGYEMHRLLWNERPKLERWKSDGERQVTLTSLLARVQSFKAAMERTYKPMLSRTVPIHALAAEVYGIISDRMYTLLLQKYITSDRQKMPPRLRQLVLSASVTIIEHAMNIEQEPAFALWSWYAGSLQQYHAALLLLSELHAASNDPALEQRVWKCMDFAFNLPPEAPNMAKTRHILKDLIHKHKTYMSLKKLRAPTNMPHARPRTQTAGYQARQREQRKRSGSYDHMGNGSASSAYGGSPSLQQQPPPGQPLRGTYGDAVPNVDWGTIELPGDTGNITQPISGADTYNFNDLQNTTTTGGMMPTSSVPTVGQVYGSDANSPGYVMYKNAPEGTAKGSAMDALKDVDWNDIEQMFGGPEVGTGMMVPPYTFPQYSPGDLQWAH